MQESLTSSLATYNRRLTLALYFSQEEEHAYDTSIPRKPSTWLPTGRRRWTEPLNSYIETITRNAHITLTKSRTFYDADAAVIRRTLLDLRANPDIIIKPADKNLGLVIMNPPDYITMCKKHLTDTHTYLPIDAKYYLPKKLFASLKKILVAHKELFCPGIVPPRLSKLADSLLQSENSTQLRIAPFYCLPKLHKQPISGRPIVSAPSTCTYYPSLYLHRVLFVLLRKLPHICLSSSSVIRSLKSNKEAQCVFTADVGSLYPSIPIEFGLSAMRASLVELSDFSPQRINFILDLLEWVLRNNYLIFDGQIFLQIHGTAMGTPVAVAYANLVLYQIEKPLLAKTLYYRRYIDDLLALFRRSQLAWEFFRLFNSACETITLETVTVSRVGVFLDLYISLLEDGTISTKLYQKPTNKYSYIPVLSSHNPMIFSNFILQEFKRYRLACTHEADFTAVADLFTTRLMARGYPLAMIARARSRVPARAALLHPAHSNRRQKSPVPIITLGLPRLCPNPEWREVFRIPRSISELLEYKIAYGNQKVVIGTKNSPNVAHILLSSLFPRKPSIFIRHHDDENSNAKKPRLL